MSAEGFEVLRQHMLAEISAGIFHVSGLIGKAATVVRAPPDGYTLLLVGSTATINATLYGKLNFNVIRDIVPVAGINRATLLMLIDHKFELGRLQDRKVRGLGALENAAGIHADLTKSVDNVGPVTHQQSGFD